MPAIYKPLQKPDAPSEEALAPAPELLGMAPASVAPSFEQAMNVPASVGGGTAPDGALVVGASKGTTAGAVPPGMVAKGSSLAAPGIGGSLGGLKMPSGKEDTVPFQRHY